MKAKTPKDRAAEGRQRATERADGAVSAWEEHPGPYARRTRHGEVVLEKVTHHSDEHGTTWVEVWAGGDVAGGDPHFRIFAPPQLVEDPNGDVEHGGRRFRRDPLAALAETVAANGGAQLPKRMRRTQG